MKMGEYKVKEIDIHNVSLRKEATLLINEVFNIGIGADKLLLNTNTRNGKSLYLGAFLDDKLVAVNFFIAHELLYNTINVVAHQSCWSATSKKHRKKGLFSLLINSAKKKLKQLGSSFILGFPNENSAPILLKKLGFRKIPLAKINIPTILLSSLSLRYYLKAIKKDYNLEINNCFIPIESELIDLKQNEYGEKIEVFTSYNNLVWGRETERQTKLGKLSFFHVGGLQVNKPHLLPILFKKILKEKDIDIIQIIGIQHNSVFKLFRGVQSAPKTEPLIIFDLNENTTSATFNFMIGIKDVF